jgi:F-type H+-transporting ATPase subunit epsilon
LSETATSVVIPGAEGELTVMANHAPTMTTLKPGVVTVTKAGGQTERFVVFGGFADILPDSCTLLAETASAFADVRRSDIEARMESVRAEQAAAGDDDTRLRLGELLDQLTSLHSTVDA